MDLRKDQRIQGITNLKIIDQDRAHPVTLMNISRRGLSVKSEYVFPTFKEIGIEMTINGRFFKVRGSIRWVNEHPEKPSPSFKEVGIRLISPPPEYLALLEELSDGAPPRQD